MRFIVQPLQRLLSGSWIVLAVVASADISTGSGSSVAGVPSTNAEPGLRGVHPEIQFTGMMPDELSKWAEQQSELANSSTQMQVDASADANADAVAIASTQSNSEAASIASLSKAEFISDIVFILDPRLR
ncbi:hypothetical protein GQ54DRAFT_310121 [Martensiomyces pterosporus]|nr:hypothetical protein GQ54DRAFT_310121 [Martensiomyces pterosporus]